MIWGCSKIINLDRRGTSLIKWGLNLFDKVRAQLNATWNINRCLVQTMILILIIISKMVSCCSGSSKNWWLNFMDQSFEATMSIE